MPLFSTVRQAVSIPDRCIVCASWCCSAAPWLSWQIQQSHLANNEVTPCGWSFSRKSIAVASWVGNWPLHHPWSNNLCFKVLQSLNKQRKDAQIINMGTTLTTKYLTATQCQQLGLIGGAGTGSH